MNNDSQANPYVDIGPHETDKLLMLQKTFERDTKNTNAAWEYFRELNRQGKFLTVIRLYKTNELAFLDRRNADMVDLIKNQYEYASDNMKCLDQAMNTESGHSSEGGQGS